MVPLPPVWDSISTLTEVANPRPGRLLTTVRNRALWTSCAPQIEVVPWNGVPLPPAPEGVVALIWVGVPADKARGVFRERWDNPGKSKWATHIDRAKDVLLHGVTLDLDLGEDPAALGEYSWSEDLPLGYLRALAGDVVVAIDIETTGLEPEHDSLVGVSLSMDEGEAVYIPCPRGVSPPILSSFLVSHNLTWVGHNAKFDWKFLAAKGIVMPPPAHDTQLIAYVMGVPSPRGLKPLAERLLGLATTHFEDVAQGQSFDKVDLDKATAYACQDADITLRLLNHFMGTFSTDEYDALWKLYDKIEVPLIPVLGTMELTGACVDCDAAEVLLERYKKEVALLEDAMWALAGQQFNPDSPKDLDWLLFKKLGLPPLKETKTGFSTDSDTLKHYAEDEPLVSLILEWRARTKLISTYLGPLVSRRPDRVHGQFNQMVTATGRLSSSNPNLQNQGPLVRQVYVAPPGKLLIAADYSQQELRLLAHMSQDPRMLSAFQNGVDIHQQTATLLSIPRRIAKNVNFGIPYGAGAPTLARQAGCSIQEANDLLTRHKAEYPVLWNWIDWTKQRAHERGYAETIWGRRRYLPDLLSVGEQRARAERQSVNVPIQGSAGDVIKIAMARLSRVLGTTCRMLLQIHDELVFELDRPELVGYVEAVIKDVMEHADDGLLTVPLIVDIHHGSTWAQLK